MGAVFLRIVDHETRALRIEFGIPDDHEPIGAIAIGHNAETERRTSPPGAVLSPR
jgi:nitroreductase